MHHSSYAIHFVPSWKTKKPEANLLAPDFFTKEPSLCSINSIPRLKRSCHMLPIDDLIRTLEKVRDHHRDRRVAPATNRRGIYPDIDLRLKPVLERIGTGIDIWCFLHQHTHSLMQVALVQNAAIQRPGEEIVTGDRFPSQEPDQ